jgi:predicted NBD/HSP70 family sugar kinase
MDKGRQGGSLTDLRRANRREALRALRRPGGLTQAEIARATGLSPASVSNIVRELAEDGAASVTMVRHNGRRARQVTLNPDAGLVVGVDFGNRHVRVAIADLAHNVLAEDYQTLSYGHRATEGIPRTEATVRHLVEKVGRRHADLIGMSVGLPGPIVASTGRLSAPTVLPGWADIDVAAAFRDQLHVSVAVDNDAKLGALAESLWGSGRGLSDFAYLKVSTGIGAGLVLNGNVYRGAGGTAGEIGHTTIEENGPVCRCGNRGCLEVLAGVPALLESLRVSHGDGITIEDVLRRSEAGDVGCQRVIIDAGRHIGVAVANLCNLLSLQRIIIGGELALAGDLLLSAITDSMARRAISISAQHTEVTTSKLGARAGVLGAVARALQEGDRYVAIPVEPAQSLALTG